MDTEKFSAMSHEEKLAMTPRELLSVIQDAKDKEAALKNIRGDASTYLSSGFGYKPKIGTVTFSDDEVDVKFKASRTIKTDQEKATALADVIREKWKKDPADFFKVEYKVTAGQLDNYPEDLLKHFLPLVEEGPGSVSIEYKIKGE